MHIFANYLFRFAVVGEFVGRITKNQYGCGDDQYGCGDDQRGLVGCFTAVQSRVVL